jgi:periplasmic protein TonB
MKAYIILVTLLIAGAAFAQTDEVYVKVDKMPEFPGGQVALVKYVSKNLKYPETARRNKISGKVMVSFIIDKGGNVTNATVVKGISPDCDSEALRVVQHMPKWSPGQKDGQAVPVQFALPINFEM